MKNKILIVALFAIFALAIPVAVLGSILTLIFCLASGISGASVLEIVLYFIGMIIGGTYILTYIFALNKTRKEKKLSVKSFLPLFHCVLALIYLASLNPAAGYVESTRERFGFAKKDFIVVEEEDTHGGFHGDGYYYLIMDCSDNKEKASELIKDWNRLPLSENLNWLIYGGVKNGTTRYGLYEEAHIPKIKNGYYMFFDRHMESTDTKDDSELFERSSYNFSFAIYDCDTNMFYYFDYDT